MNLLAVRDPRVCKAQNRIIRDVAEQLFEPICGVFEKLGEFLIWSENLIEIFHSVAVDTLFKAEHRHLLRIYKLLDGFDSIVFIH